MTNTELTFGQKLTGVDFNPSKNPKVDRLKELFAEAADIVHEQWLADHTAQSNTINLLYQHTIGEILNAQMNAVKFVVTDFSKF